MPRSISGDGENCNDRKRRWIPVHRFDDCVYRLWATRAQVADPPRLVSYQPEVQGKIVFLLRLLINPWVFSGFVGAFLASLAWMAAMTKFEISHAYPFMSLNFVFVILAGGLLFHEAITPYKLVGLALIIAGLIVGSRG